MRPANYQAERGERQEARVLAALAEGPMTTAQLQAKLSMSRASVGIYIRRLIARPRRVYITGYDPAPEIRGRRAPIYALGSGKHASEPPARTGAEKFKMLKADPDLHERHLAKRRTAVLVKSAKRAPNGWASALLGTGSREVRHA